MNDPTSGRTPPPPIPPPGAGVAGPHEGARDEPGRAGGAGHDIPPPPPPGPHTGQDGPLTPSDAVQRPGLDDRDRTLDPTIVKVWRVTGALGMIIPLGILITLSFVALDRFGWFGVAIALLLLWLRVWWLPPARYARWRWKLTPLALELRYGVVVRQYEAVPYFRIQQIDITQGPIDRMLGLATLVVATASASGSATLPGITADDAPAVRAELLARAAEAVAEHPGDLQDAV